MPRGYLQDLCRYWATDYDWPATQQRLNELPQFLTTIDGLPIHFIHIPSGNPDAVPLVLTHGWPGSFLEFERCLPGLAEEFHLVVPSLPGYGFSGRPTVAGWGVQRIARAWVELTSRLGYGRFIAAGSDWGTSVSTCIALQSPGSLLGLHLVPPLVPADPRTRPSLTAGERRAELDLAERSADGSGYSAVHGTRPQTIGYALVDSPVGLCAWILEKIWAWSDHDGDLESVLSRDQVLDNISLYWLTATGASSIRLYWESIAQVSAWFAPPPSGVRAGLPDLVTVPTGCTVFPREVPRPSRRWAEQRFPNIVHWGEPSRGGHFGAWEQPGLFINELLAFRQALAASR